LSHVIAGRRRANPYCVHARDAAEATGPAYPPPRANQALSDLREGRLLGAAVLVP
jgi:hypothetical protein